jgi:hypothetical protein
VAIAAEKQNRLSVPLRTHEVVAICDEGNVKIPGAEWMNGRDDRDSKICPFVGRFLKRSLTTPCPMAQPKPLGRVVT